MSGDSPPTFSSILSGEGFDERERGASPLAVSARQFFSTSKDLFFTVAPIARKNARKEL
jgi:hypothetical protein